MERENITELLVDWSNGDETALEKLMPLVYRELHSIAHRFIRKERSDFTLQTTALLNEAYIRIIDQNRTQWKSRSHFYAVAANVMRRILVDYARRYTRKKRKIDPLSQHSPQTFIKEGHALELIELDRALTQLEEFDPRKCKVVELRYFGGLTIDETAEVLNTSKASVIRDWTIAKAWLRKEIIRES
jgi:RNA polymerase sigma-70 factor, ECF subfamily